MSQSVPSNEVEGKKPLNYLTDGTTAMSWLNTRDHKRVGVMFLAAVTFFFLIGGVFALLIRIELLTPGPTIMSPNAYNKLFTLHGIVMIFLFMIPAIPSGLGNFLLPLMIGAKDVAFPRLNLASFYVYLIGAVMAIGGMVAGGLDTGWTFYAPYSTTTTTTVIPVLLGAFVIGFSSIMTGLNFIVTIHTMRSPGMTWGRVPLFVWSMYATSVIQILATPVLGVTLLLIALERAFQMGIFDAAQGGDPVLLQHLFWFYSHPAVYIMVLPSMGVASEVICGLSKKNAFGYKAIAYSSLGIAFVGFFVWGHHMFTSTQSTFAGGIFGVLSMLVGIFTAIKVFSWIGTIYGGSIQFSTPYFYIVGFLYFVIFGGMTGIALATMSLDLHWHDTYFVVAHFHFVMVSATVMAFLAGVHYWFPKIFGKAIHEGWGMLAAGLIILGFNATFIPQFLLGNAGMPRRYYSYPAEFQMLNVASTAGASLLAFGLIIVAAYLGYALVHGEAVDNPWGSRGFEWMTASPPIKANFEVTPVYTTEPHHYVDEPDQEKRHVG
ncbi:MAG: cbb3-type cytochrome c oxidase subunit I [Polyangia bacterium]